MFLAFSPGLSELEKTYNDSLGRLSELQYQLEIETLLNDELNNNCEFFTQNDYIAQGYYQFLRVLVDGPLPVQLKKLKEVVNELKQEKSNLESEFLRADGNITDPLLETRNSLQKQLDVLKKKHTELLDSIIEFEDPELFTLRAKKQSYTLQKNHQDKTPIVSNNIDKFL